MKQSTDSQTNPSPKTPTSERKASANRANAKRSTGPRTLAGKARSSLNALRHGILARAAFNAAIEGEERRAEFEELVAGLAQEYQPRTMTEHMTVQQLAGCYWRLAKVWRFEQEAAWRTWLAPGMPMEEFNQFHADEYNAAITIREIVSEQAQKFLPEAGLGEATIPNGPSARTILRYQGAINTMMTRCLTILERRRKERMASDEAFEEVDYTNEATEHKPKAKASSEKPVASSKDGNLHKRTEKDGVDATVSSTDGAQVENTASNGDEHAPKTAPPKS